MDSQKVNLFGVEWVEPASPFARLSKVELLGLIICSPQVKSVFPLSFWFPLPYLASFPACPVESASTQCDPRAVHLISLSSRALFALPSYDFPRLPPFPSNLHVSGDLSFQATNHSHAQKRQPDLQLDDRHDTLQGKLRKHQKVLQIVLGNIHLDEKEKKNPRRLQTK